MRKLLAVTVLIVLIVASIGLAHSNQQPHPRPNIIFILVDDLRWDELSIAGHPFLKTPRIDRIGKEGALFRNAFMTTPLCSPSRASFLTGNYAHTHGITDNVDRSVASHKLITFPLLLHQAGYATAFIGKWHMGNDDSPRPGFDRWVSFKGQGSYLSAEINEDGRDVKPSGYITDILNEYAVEFIRRRHDKPFLVYLAHKAIHPEVMQHGDGSINMADAERFIPAERHRNLFVGKKIPRRPSAMQSPTGKPALERKIDDLPPLGAKTATADHEESIRMPLLVRYPPMIKAGTVRDEFALNIDLAPTVLELAGVSAPKVDGRSLVPLLNGVGGDWRRSFLIEYYSDRVIPRVRQMGYKAIRTERWKYIHYIELDGMDELYDLSADPYEMKNIINQPGAGRTLEAMKHELEGLQKN